MALLGLEREPFSWGCVCLGCRRQSQMNCPLAATPRS